MATKAKAKSEPTDTSQPEAANQAVKLIKIPVAAGIQAGRRYFTAMICAKDLARLFPELADFPTQAGKEIEKRFQRELDRKRSKLICQYIREGMTDGKNYTLTAVAASVRADVFKFKPRYANMGTLEFSHDASIFLFDGQHRIRGLILAAEKDEAISQESLSIVIYEHVSVEWDQQSFSDVNSKAVAPSKSLMMAFDHRDEAIAISRRVLADCPKMRLLIDYDRSSCTGKNTLMFPLQVFHRANQYLFHDASNPDVIHPFAVKFWESVIELNPVYNAVHRIRKHAQTAREESIAPMPLALEAIALHGYKNRDSGPEFILTELGKMGKFDWRKDNAAMLAACTDNGRLNKSTKTIDKLREFIFCNSSSDF